MNARSLPLIDGLLDAPAVHLLTSGPDTGLVACREAVLAAMAGSLLTGAPCLGREPARRGGDLTLVASVDGQVERIAERLELWSELTAAPIPVPGIASFREAMRGGDHADWWCGRIADVAQDIEAALIVVGVGGLLLPQPVTSPAEASQIVDRLRWVADTAGLAVILDLSEGDDRIGSPDLFAPSVDAVLAIDPDQPAVHVHRSGELVATYEPALGLVGEMAVVS